LGSQPLNEFFDLHFHVLKDLAQQSWPDCFASMNWNYCRAAIRMSQVTMAPFDSEDIETCSPQDRDSLRGRASVATAAYSNRDALHADELSRR
jgi:hypothetical protein